VRGPIALPNTVSGALSGAAPIGGGTRGLGRWRCCSKNFTRQALPRWFFCRALLFRSSPMLLLSTVHPVVLAWLRVKGRLGGKPDSPALDASPLSPAVSSAGFLRHLGHNHGCERRLPGFRSSGTPSRRAFGNPHIQHGSIPQNSVIISIKKPPSLVLQA